MYATLRSQLSRRLYQTLLIFGCWTALALISLARHYMVEVARPVEESFWKAFPIWLTCYYSWALLTPPVFWVARRWPLTRKTWGRNVAVHSFLSLGFTGAALFLSRALHLLWTQHTVGGLAGYMTHLNFVSFVKHFPFYWSTLAVASVLAYFRTLQEKERLAAQLEIERSQLETSLRQAQLDALRMQLNPHFLFNTLQTISVLMMDDTSAANRMLVRLSDLLRSTLRNSVESVTPLRDELAFLRAYLAIEQIRFEDRLRVNWKIDPETEDAMAPTLLLQPLVENSIRHGIARLAAPGTITIESRVAGQTLHLSVADTGPGITPRDEAEISAGHGIGLSNTRKRLKQLYPEHRLEIDAGPHGGFTVHVEIPFVRRSAVQAPELVAL